jgi:hypothetical protein
MSTSGLRALTFVINGHIDRVTKKTQNDIENPMEIEQEKYNEINNTTNELLFSTDICLLYENDEQLQNHLNSLSEISRKFDMEINNIKTEAMRISRMQKPLNSHIYNSQVKQVSEF